MIVFVIMIVTMMVIIIMNDCHHNCDHYDHPHDGGHHNHPHDGGRHDRHHDGGRPDVMMVVVIIITMIVVLMIVIMTVTLMAREKAIGKKMCKMSPGLLLPNRPDKNSGQKGAKTKGNRRKISKLSLMSGFANISTPMGAFHFVTNNFVTADFLNSRQCTMGLYIALRISKITKSKGPDFAQF